MRLFAIVFALVVTSGCVSQREFNDYKVENYSMLLKMAELHKMAAIAAKDHEERIATMEAHHNARAN